MSNKPINNQSELSSPLPPSVKRAASNIKLAGQVGFWTQLVLGVVSLVILLVAAGSILFEKDAVGTNPGAGFGIFFAASGIIALAIGIFFSFRYMQIAKLLQNPNQSIRPNRVDTLQVIRVGLIVNLLGMLFTIIGAEAIVGIVLAKSLATPPTAIGTASQELVTSLDLLVVQANTNTIAAHFTGIVSSLLLLNRITR